MMASQKVKNWLFPSFRRKPESSYFKVFWTPAFAGVTIQETFYEAINVDDLVKSQRAKMGSKFL